MQAIWIEFNIWKYKNVTHESLKNIYVHVVATKVFESNVLCSPWNINNICNFF